MDMSLKDFLMGQPGSQMDETHVEFLLAEVWKSLRGSREGGMQALMRPGGTS
jgi:hypothetical protein